MTNRQHSERSAQSQRYAEGEQPTASTVAKEPEATMSTQEQPNPNLAAPEAIATPTPEAPLTPPAEPVGADAQAPQVFRAMTREELEAATAPPPPPPPPPFRVMTREDHAASFSALPATLPSLDQPQAGPCRKVAILGFTDSWKTAPFDDPTWEIWGLNELYLFIPRWTRWFELHQRDVWMADTKRTQEHLRKLAAMTCPVYMHQHWPDIPCSVPYPLQDVANAFRNPAGGIPYLTNSISLMIALALLDGFTEIKVCGVDMSHDSEYQSQRPSCEYFVGIAQGRGVQITLPPECELLKTDFIYGYQQPELERWNARMLARERDFDQKLQQIDQQIAQLTEARGQYRGALQDTQHIRKNWKGLIAA